VEVKMTGSGLRIDQAAAAFHVLTSDRRVEVIVGPAGSGKTHVLAQIGNAWSHGRVVGITPSQSSRDVLAAAGITESYNFAQFLGHLKDQRGALGPVTLRPGDVIVMDESSMFGNPDLGDIVDYAAKSGVKVVMALDHRQLQAVENGGGASLVTRAQGYVQLPEPVRFTEHWERSASLGLREGKVAALAEYAEHGRIRAGAAEEILEAAAQAYIAHTLEGKDSLLIARAHEVRREVCRRVRGELQHLGLVARDGRRSRLPTASGPVSETCWRVPRTIIRWMPAACLWLTSMCCASRRSPSTARWSAGCSSLIRRPRRRAGQSKRSCIPATRPPNWDTQ
jgi:AAA domain